MIRNNMKELIMYGTEAEMFGYIVDDEIKIIYDGFDPDTGRAPGQARRKAIVPLERLYAQWKRQQDIIGRLPDGTPLFDSGNSRPCTVTVDEAQVRVMSRILNGIVRDVGKTLAKYPEPHTGTLGDVKALGRIAGNILAKLQ